MMGVVFAAFGTGFGWLAIGLHTDPMLWEGPQREVVFWWTFICAGISLAFSGLALGYFLAEFRSGGR